MTSRVLAKLEDAFRFGANKVEACLWAEIDESTLWRYCETHEGFATKIEAWQSEIVMIARLNIAKSIRAGNVNDSWSYLRVKRREEFSEKYVDNKYLNAITVEELEEMARNGVVLDDSIEE